MNEQAVNYEQAVATLGLLPTFSDLASRWTATDFPEAFTELQVPAPDIPTGVASVKAKLSLSTHEFDIDFLLEAEGSLRFTFYRDATEAGQDLVTNQLFILTPYNPEQTAKGSRLFYGAVTAEGAVISDPSEDKMSSLNPATLSAVTNVLPGVVTFLQQLARGDTSGNYIMPLSIYDPHAHVEDMITILKYDLGAEFEQLAPKVGETVEAVLAEHEHSTHRPDKDTLIYVEYGDGCVFEHRLIEYGDGKSSAITVKTQKGALALITDTSGAADCIFSTRFGEEVPLEALQNSRYDIAFKWSPDEDLSLGYKAMDLHPGVLKMLEEHMALLSNRIDPI